MGGNNFGKKLKFRDEVRKLSSQYVSLVTVRDQDKDTLNLAVIVGNKVAELRMNMKKIPNTDMIHLDREASDIIYTHLLQETL